MKLVLASPRGFCSGVKRSLALVDRVLSEYSPPIYAFHAIVHNEYVVAQLRKRGVVFVDDIHDIPEHAVVIFSAHGVSQEIYAQAKARGLKIFDATCPRVKKIHAVVQAASRNGNECMVIGRAQHAETKGIIGQYAEKKHIHTIETLQDITKLVLRHPEQCIYVTQTTFPCELSRKIIEALHQKFSALKHQTIHYCTVVEKRQAALKKMTKTVDAIIILGSQTSSNAQALKKIATQAKIKTYLIDSPDELQPNWFDEALRIGIATSASAPEILVEKTLQWFNTNFKKVQVTE
jgi:4-hydroxy-3-methylbut-2-enyl diphosphate reductase